jgi:hypothetical protein
VTKFMQHRALLGKNQQQRKNQSKANSGSIHGLAKNGSPETTTTPKEQHLRSALHSVILQSHTEPSQPGPLCSSGYGSLAAVSATGVAAVRARGPEMALVMSAVPVRFRRLPTIAASLDSLGRDWIQPPNSADCKGGNC